MITYSSRKITEIVAKKNKQLIESLIVKLVLPVTVDGEIDLKKLWVTMSHFNKVPKNGQQKSCNLLSTR